MAFAVLYLPLIDEFGGSRGEVATVQSVLFLVSGLTGPLVGWAFDRLGPRRLFQWSAALAALALVAASRATSLPLLVLTYGLLAGLGLEWSRVGLILVIVLAVVIVSEVSSAYLRGRVT